MKTGLLLKWIFFRGGAFFLVGVRLVSQAAAIWLSSLNFWLSLFLTFLAGALTFAIFFALKKIRPSRSSPFRHLGGGWQRRQELVHP